MTVEFLWRQPGRYYPDDCDVSALIGTTVRVDGQPSGKVLSAKPEGGALRLTIETDRMPGPEA